jgi:multiple sugar transport system substrate-binding protein
MKRILSIACLATAGLIAATFVTAQNATLPPLPKNQTTSITFYNYNLASAGVGAEATKQLIAEFMAANPAVKVEGVPAPSDQIMARLQADVVAGRTPDVAQVVFSDLEFAATNLGAQPLEALTGREWVAHTVGMHPRGLDLGKLEGKTYGLPYVFSTPVLFYNADLFKAAGLDANKPPRTWDEVKSVALTIKAKTGKMGFFPGAFGAFDWMFQGLVLSNGGRVLSEDRKRLTYAETGGLGAVRMLRDLVDSGAMPNITSAEAQAAMAAGGLGMYLQTSALQNFLLTAGKDKWELKAGQMPAFKGKLARPTNSGSALVILSKDPVKQRAAWELMKFLTSKRGYTIITSRIGYLPLRTEIVKDPQYLAGWAAQNPLVFPNLAQLDRLSPWVPMPGTNYRQISKIMMDALEAAVFGKGDPDEAMKAAQERASSLMPK